MGQAKQRVKQAQEEKDDFYGTKKSIAEVIAELGLPKDSTVKGYIINLPEKNEFVAQTNDDNISFSVAYTRTPELAKIYDKSQKAISDAKKISKHKLLVCVLLETSNYYVINDIWANY